MAKDYANHSPKKRKPTARNKARKPVVKPFPRWPWMLSGFLLGVVGTITVQRWENPQQNIAQVIEDIAGGNVSKPLKPRFDFYTLLPVSEVPVSDAEPSPERGSQVNDEIFMLQAGSFRSTSDADSLRIRLLLLNMDAHVEAATSKSAGTWHRVIVGPFTSRSKLANARATLSQNGIDSLMLKRREDG